MPRLLPRDGFYRSVALPCETIHMERSFIPPAVGHERGLESASLLRLIMWITLTTRLLAAPTVGLSVACAISQHANRPAVSAL